MRILCNLNPDFETSEFKWRISAGGLIHLVKEVRWKIPAWTDFNPEFGPQGGFVIAANGRLDVVADGSLAIVS